MAGRCELAVGDFFREVPAGCDAYVLKSILHDWDDEHCTAILRHCARTLSGAGRVLVVEMIVPPPGTPSFAKLLDLELLVLTEGGRERTEREFAALFSAAGLELTRVIPTDSASCVLEARRA